MRMAENAMSKRVTVEWASKAAMMLLEGGLPPKTSVWAGGRPRSFVDRQQASVRTKWPVRMSRERYLREYLGVAMSQVSKLVYPGAMFGTLPIPGGLVEEAYVVTSERASLRCLVESWMHPKTGVWKSALRFDVLVGREVW